MTLQVADLDNAGQLDLIVAFYLTGSIATALSNPDGSFGPFRQIMSGPGPA